MEQDQNAPQQLQIELTPEVAGGTYTNLAIINHSNQEFVIDFIAALPGLPKARVWRRMLSDADLLRPNRPELILQAWQACGGNGTAQP